MVLRLNWVDILTSFNIYFESICYQETSDMVSDVTSKNIDYNTVFLKPLLYKAINHFLHFLMWIFIIYCIVNDSCLILKISITRFSTLEKFLRVGKNLIFIILTLLQFTSEIKSVIQIYIHLQKEEQSNL